MTKMSEFGVMAIICNRNPRVISNDYVQTTGSLAAMEWNWPSSASAGWVLSLGH